MSKIRKCVIPVAGMGTRFLPATKAIPKEMLPIIDKPTIQYIVEEAINSGIEEILFITSPYKNSVIDHFDRSYELEHRLVRNNKVDKCEMLKEISSLANFTYIRQGEPLGSGHAIKLAKEFVNNEPFAIMYGDDIMKSDVPVLKQLIDIYEKTDSNVIAVQEVRKEDVSKYGIISYKDQDKLLIDKIIEKPNVNDAPSLDAGLGRYIVKPEIFDELDNLKLQNNEYIFTNALLSLMDKQDFYACKFDGKYFDIGNQYGYIKANVEFALDREDLKEDMGKYIKDLSNKIN